MNLIFIGSCTSFRPQKDRAFSMIVLIPMIVLFLINIFENQFSCCLQIASPVHSTSNTCFHSTHAIFLWFSKVTWLWFCFLMMASHDQCRSRTVLRVSQQLVTWPWHDKFRYLNLVECFRTRVIEFSRFKKSRGFNPRTNVIDNDLIQTNKNGINFNRSYLKFRIFGNKTNLDGMILGTTTE